jgi:hypothetical protein
MWLENFPLVVQRVLFLKTNNFVLVNSVNSRQILLFAIRDSLEFPVWHFYFFQLQLLIAVAWSVWKWYLIWSMSIVPSPFAVRNSDIRSTPTHLGILDHATKEILDQRFYSCFLPEKYFLTVSSKLFQNACCGPQELVLIEINFFDLQRR